MLDVARVIVKSVSYQGGWGKPGTLLMCGLTNWEMAGRKAPPKGVKANVGRSLWTPHTFKNLNDARVRLIASGPAASHSIIITEDNKCLAFGRNDKGKRYAYISIY